MAVEGTLVTGGLVVGDRFVLRREVVGITPGVTISKAWLTVKDDLSVADPGVFQKVITPSYTSAGQILDDGSDGTAVLDFVIDSVDTLALQPGQKYWYDVQVETSTGEIHTLEVGTFVPLPQVTQATS